MPLGEYREFSGSGIHGHGSTWKKGLLFQDTGELVTNKSADDKDDHEEDNLDKNTKQSQETDINTRATGNYEHRNEYKDNTKDDTGYRAIPEYAHVILFPAMKKAKDNTQNQVQYFKQHTNSLGLGNITSPPP
jgi:hypothetical protein